MTALEGRLTQWIARFPRDDRLAAVAERAAALPALILLAVALRVPLWLAGHPLHHDEALYGAWAQLIASGQDPLLLSAWVDKPPLALYLLAASVRLFGASEWVLRMPGMFASILTIPLLYEFARAAYGARTARLATALLAVSAFAIQFAPTAFADPWLTLWLVAGAWAAISGHAFWAGIALGLAVATKQQGLLGAPLVLALLALHQQRQAGRLRLGPFVASALIPGLVGFGLIFVPMTWWDSLRWAKRPSFWDRSLTTYGGLRLATPKELPGRALAWMPPFGYLFGPPLVTVLMLALAGLPAIRALTGRGRREFVARLDLLLTGAVLAFAVVHLLATFQPWDRYLLPLTPVLAVLAARGLILLPRLSSGGSICLPVREHVWSACAALLALALSFGAVTGALGRLPVGSDHGANAGVRELARELRDLPSDAVVYYHSLGWHYDYYLFDAPQERRWWDSAWKLAGDAAATAVAEPDRPQWVIMPAADAGELDDLVRALRARGLAVVGLRRTVTVGSGPATRLYLVGPFAETRGP